MNKNETKENKIRVGSQDVWNAFMVKGAEFSENDIPICPTIMSDYPKNIITWLEAKKIHKDMIKKDKRYFYDAFICFYIDDQYFDKYSNNIWIHWRDAYKIIKHFKGIITPDYSTYSDFPEPISRFNTYRMRAFGFWVGKNGKEVINNVRWGWEYTYSYSYDGIQTNGVVAIGTVGGSPRKLEDRERFEKGLYEMVNRLQPHTIIVYGSANYPCFDDLRNRGIRIISYKGQTCRAFERSKSHEQRV